MSRVKADQRLKNIEAQKVAGVNAGIKGNPRLKAAQVGCTDAICGLVESIEAVEGGGKRMLVHVRVGADEVLKVATTWSVVVGKVVAVATVGSFCGDVVVSKGAVGGIETNGKLLDAATLGWAGGAAGAAAVLPSRFEAGDPAPDVKPKRSDAVVTDAAGNTISASQVDAVDSLYASKPKLTKEEKKAAQKKAKAAKKAAKAAAKGETVAEVKEEEEVELKKATKGQLKAIKKECSVRRKGGEEDVNTDEELEAAGYFSQ